MKCSVFSAARHVKESYLRYLKTAYSFADTELQKKFEHLLHDAATVTKGPYITLAREHRDGMSLAEMVRKDILHPDLLKLDWRFDTNEPLYLHQERAIVTAAERRPYLVTTGTGSGKTECFLIPILDWCVKHRGPGLKAVIIYPMNALANDQKARLDELQIKERLGLTSEIYTSQLEESLRKQARETPPDIMITNYKQMEFLLVRKLDRGMFGTGVRFLVLDEIHSYRGAQATEIACLIRRLKAHTGLRQGEILCVGTSATAAAGAEGIERLSRFASTLFGEAVREDDCIGSEYKPADDDGAPEFVPPVADVSESELQELDKDDDETVFRTVEKLTGQRLSRGVESPGEIIRRALSGNAVVRRLEGALVEPRPLDDIVADLRQISGRSGVSAVALQREATAYLKVGSYHRDENDRPRFRPKLHSFFHGAYNVTLCANPACRKFSPYGDTKCRSCESWSAPVVICRTCGQEYHKARIDPESESLKGTADFFTSDDSVYLTPKIHLEEEDEAEPDDEEPDLPGVPKPSEPRLREVKRLEVVDLCVRCGKIQSALKCRDCGTDTVPYYLFRGRMHTCPACRNSAGKAETVSPLRTGAAASSSVLITHHIETMKPAEQKLLVFIDNRQDVAHQSGYTEDKHRKFSLRHWILHLIRTHGKPRDLYLEELPQKLFDSFVREVFPGRLSQLEKEKWLEALSIQSAAEFTRAARQRGSIEMLGMAEVDYEFPENILENPQFVDMARRAGVTPERFCLLARAMLDVMRLTAAVDYDFLQQPLNPLRTRRLEELQNPPYSVRFPERGYQPKAFAFDRTQAVIQSGLVPAYVREAGGTGRFPAIQNLFAAVLGKKKEDVSDLIRETVHFLANPDIRMLVHPTNFAFPPKLRTASLKLYQINRHMIRLREPRDLFKCARCGTVRSYDLGICPRKTDARMLRNAVNPENYYVRFYGGNPMRMRVAEHSAQVPEAKRKDLEEAFKKGDVQVLIASPTMELGVDIGGLSSVVLRGAPPSPANYVQRAGRAARRLGIGFISTLCTGNSHDRHAFEQPEYYVAGRFNPPTIRLDNPLIVHRHLRSFILENLETPFPPMMEEFLDKYIDPEMLMKEPFEKVCAEVKRKKQSLTALLSTLFDKDRKDSHISRYDSAECARVVEEFEREIHTVFERWWRRVQHLHNEWKIYKKFGSPRFDKRRAEAKEKAYYEITRDRERAYTLNYLADDGFLPSYQFPTDMFTLDTGIDLPTMIRRAAHIGISEFAPGNAVYANGRKLKPIRVLISGSSPHLGAEKNVKGQLETRYFCRTCDAVSETLRNSCPVCGSEMDGREILLADSFEAMSESKIGSDEESREQKYFDVRTFLVSAEVKDPNVYKYQTCDIELRERSNILLCNFGTSEMRGARGGGFTLCRECGRYHPNPNPQTKKDIKDMQKWKEQHDRYCGKAVSGDNGVTDARFSELALAYAFSSDTLILTPRSTLVPGESQAPYWHETLMESLIVGAIDFLELEPREIQGFIHRLGRDQKQIVLYETTAGGAGYLSEIASKIPSIVQAAGTRIYSHDCLKACYLCLLGYHNRRWHDYLDKLIIRKFIDEAKVDRLISRTAPKPKDPPAMDGPVSNGTGMRLAAVRPPAAVRVPEDQQGSEYEVGYIETRLLDAIQKIEGLPAPDPQYEFRGADGHVVTVADFAYPNRKIAIYCDSLEHHMNRQALAKDADKRNWLQSMGWKVLVFWGHVIREDPRRCAMEILEAYRVADIIE